MSAEYISPKRVSQPIRLAYEFRKLPINHHAHIVISQVQNHIMFSSSKCISSLTNVKDKLLESITAPGTLIKLKAPKEKESTKRKIPEEKNQGSESKRQSPQIKSRN